MFNRPDFQQSDEETLFQCIERYSFATLVSAHESGVEISHLPLLLDRSAHRVVGHMARANQHWSLAESRPVVAIFKGPHAYISPRWYQEQDVVPTWNYVVAHVHGTLQVLNDSEVRLDVLQQYVAAYEQSLPEPWSVDEEDGSFIRKLAEQTVAFEVPIERIEAKWKLSQNHSPERRERVIAALDARGTENDRAVADLMRPRP